MCEERVASRGGGGAGGGWGVHGKAAMVVISFITMKHGGVPYIQ